MAASILVACNESRLSTPSIALGFLLSKLLRLQFFWLNVFEPVPCPDSFDCKKFACVRTLPLAHYILCKLASN